ncbi:MAG: efflux RND transporter periplasmic adaptor subunit [Candidatus Tectimicrobiota bacterium]
MEEHTVEVQREVAYESILPPAPRHRWRRGFAWGLGALGLLAVGALGGILGVRYLGDGLPLLGVIAPTRSAAVLPVAEFPPVEPPAASAPTAIAEVFLTPEAVTRAGIQTVRAEVLEAQTALQLPGTVTADAYREVKVVPIAGGIVTKVHVELGTTVKRGAPLATLFSPELAEAQTKYLSMRAMLVADHQKLQRTQQLVEIGAASRQELEDITAVHASHATEVEAARQRLLLLGLSRAHVEALTSPSQVVSDVTVPAPIAGVITSRMANLGQVASMAQELFVVTDLSQVWVIGDLYEQDFQTVQVGSEAAMTTPAYPGLTLRGRVSYVDPRVEPQTRTAKIRVEVPNPQGRLRLGMYATMTFTTRNGERLVVVPRAAVQPLGERHIVFMPVSDEAGRFVPRIVQIGPARGDCVTIRSGVGPGEDVVAEGSFYLRAEMVRNAPSSS